MTTPQHVRKTAHLFPSRSSRRAPSHARKSSKRPDWESQPGYRVTWDMLKDRHLALDNAGWPLDL